MTYGNCFLGAIILMAQKRTFKLRIHRRHKWDLPHFYIKDKEGVRWYYGVDKDILPYPWGFIIYKGNFRPMRKRLKQINSLKR